MKRICILTFSLLVCINCFSQKDSSYFEFGLNSARILTMFNANAEQQLSPYLLHAEYNSGRFGIRLGAGFSSQSSDELPGAANGNIEFVSDSVSTDVRFGLVIQNRLSPGWSFRFGVDAVLSNKRITNETITENAFDELVTTFSQYKRRETGAAPFVWLQYHLSNRVSIATEMQLFITTIKSNDVEKNSEFPQFDTERIIESNRFALVPPTALYLLVRF